MRSFKNRVLSVVKAIPEGKVATYGQIAAMAGSPRAARQVGGILSALEDETIPWQRVVNAKGMLSTYRRGIGELQKALLLSEGICFDEDKIDLKKYRWP